MKKCSGCELWNADLASYCKHCGVEFPGVQDVSAHKIKNTSAGNNGAINWMLGFTKSAYRHYIGVLLWINLIICVVLGERIGKGASYIIYGDGALLGALLGAFIGMFINIVIGGTIATFLNIDKNIEKIADKYTRAATDSTN